MSITRPNLADAFKHSAVDRAAPLTGLLPVQRPAKAPPVVESAPDPSFKVTEVDSTPQREAAKAVRKPQQTPARPPVSEQANIVTSVAVYLEPDLLDLARERRRVTGISYDELTGDAFDTVSDEQLIRQFQPRRGITSTTGMPTRQRRVRGTAGIQVQLRLDTNQRAWLEQKQHDVGAPSRSALVATALRLYLTA